MFMLMFLSFLSVGFLSALVTSSPALLMVWLIFLTINVGLLMNLSITAWMMYSIILLFTGGMMVLFTYMVTLVFSLKTTFSNSPIVIVVIWISLLVVLSSHPYTYTQSIVISDLYLLSMMGSLALLGGYLLLVLLAVVKLAVGFSGPLKSFFKNEF